MQLNEKKKSSNNDEKVHSVSGDDGRIDSYKLGAKISP